MWSSQKAPPSENQLTPEEIAILTTNIKNFNDRFAALNKTNMIILEAVGFTVFSYFFTSWIWLVGTGSLGAWIEYNHKISRNLWQKHCEQDDAYQKELAKLLETYLALIKAHGPEVSYDKNFLELTKVIADLLEINDLVPQGTQLKASAGYKNILANSRHARTYVNMKDNMIESHAPAPNEKNTTDTQRFYAPVVSFSYHAIYGLKQKYRANVPKLEKENPTSVVDSAKSLTGLALSYLRLKSA